MSKTIYHSSREDLHLLTRQNLSRLESKFDEHTFNSNCELLDRYLQQITSSSTCNDSTSFHVQLNKSKIEDLVLASPRLLPFPYHNDSLFFPTAEHLQYLYSHSTDSSSLSPTESYLFTQPLTSRSSTPQLDSSSILVPPSPIAQGSTPPHVTRIYNRFYGVNNSSRNNTSSMPSLSQQHQYCTPTSSSICSGSQKQREKELSSLSLVIDQSSVSKGSKRGFLSRLSTFRAASSSSASSVSSMEIASKCFFETASSISDCSRKKSIEVFSSRAKKSAKKLPQWLGRIVNTVFGSACAIKKGIRSSSTRSTLRKRVIDDENHSSVWYCKYKENPKSISLMNVATRKA